jgi:hypothetical protein
MTTLAFLDVAPEMLRDCVNLIPSTIKIVGSEASPLGSVAVRLRLDVTATGNPTGGEWIGVFTVQGARFTIDFMPRLRVKAEADASAST